MIAVVDVLSGLTAHTVAIALAAFSAFGAMFCRVRQITLQSNTFMAWLLYVAFAAATGWIGLRALFFGVADPADILTVVGVWALLLHTYDSWVIGPPQTIQKRSNDA